MAGFERIVGKPESAGINRHVVEDHVRAKSDGCSEPVAALRHHHDKHFGSANY